MQKQNWLGPYQVKTIVKNGTFRINDFDNNLIGIFKQMNLKKYNETISQEVDDEETIDNDHESSNPPDSIIASAEVHKSIATVNNLTNKNIKNGRNSITITTVIHYLTC